MSAKLEALSQNLQKHFGEKLKSLKNALGEITIEVAAADYLEVMLALRDEADFRFEEMIDLCVKPVLDNVPGMTEEGARAMMNDLFPQLKRWRA